MADDRGHDIFLVPGFFGFTYLGDVKYWTHVRAVLGPELEERGLSARIHYVDTPPTASLKARTAHLAARIAEQAEDGAAVHLIGHSSGGLDARLLAVSAWDDPALAAAQARLSSVVTVATPHHGTPLAGLFASVGGQRLLRLLSLATVAVLRTGRLPLALAAKLSKAVIAPESSVLDQVANQILGEFSRERRDALAELFDDVRRDTALLAQITPEAMEVLHATLPEPDDGVRHGCVVTRSRHPRLRTMAELGLDPYAQAMHTVFRWLHGQSRLAEDPGEAWVFPEDAYPGEAAPGPEDSDGVVPTLSQGWGELIHACWADHLDVIGHYEGPDDDPPHYDWIPSGTGFDRRRFTSTWQDVAEFLARSVPR